MRVCCVCTCVCLCIATLVVVGVYSSRSMNSPLTLKLVRVRTYLHTHTHTHMLGTHYHPSCFADAACCQMVKQLQTRVGKGWKPQRPLPWLLFTITAFRDGLLSALYGLVVDCTSDFPRHLWPFGSLHILSPRPFSV